MPIIVTCSFCAKDFETKPYRIANGRVAYCSCSCARKALFQSGYKVYNQKDDEIREKARTLYTRSSKTIDQIISELNISRGSLFGWARKGHWIKFQRDYSVRTKYRKAAETKLGRVLNQFEQVHHIDGDMNNNNHENLATFSNAADHTAAHKSLESCAFTLFKQGLIVWDEDSGRYRLR